MPQRRARPLPAGGRALLPMLAALLAGSPAGPALAADLDIVLDQARILHLPQGVSTLVVGNPAIADVTVQRSVAIVTGKAYGRTNLILLDGQGDTLSESQVVVRPPEATIVTVQRGLDRESLTCAPLCERTLRVGDATAAFNDLSSQVSARSSLASGQAAAQPAQPIMSSAH